MARKLDPDTALLQAAGDPTRLQILRELATTEEVCACDFTVCGQVSQPTVSHHLRVLRESGWVSAERRGTWVHYRLRPEAVERFRRLTAELTPAAGNVGLDVKRRLPVVQPA
jgi:ArsR family transcriptional regulator, arsenate/arsenite/antimonite-responsive transcriptional repressor